MASQLNNATRLATGNIVRRWSDRRYDGRHILRITKITSNQNNNHLLWCASGSEMCTSAMNSSCATRSAINNKLDISYTRRYVSNGSTLGLYITGSWPRHAMQLTAAEGKFLQDDHNRVLPPPASCTSLPNLGIYLNGAASKSAFEQVLYITACLNHSRNIADTVFSRSSLLQVPDQLAIFGAGHYRYIHTTSVARRDESKVEETLEAIKENIKQKEMPTIAPSSIAPSEASTEQKEVAVPKKSLKDKIIAELKHYYHGFRLLFIDFRVAARLIWQVLNGKSLSRREQKQLVRTTADMFRLVPFLFFVIVPFAEFLLPVALKLFPGMLPSTFKEEDVEKEKARKVFKGKLEMAKFLQETLEETALQRSSKDNKETDSVHEFGQFLSKIRTSGQQTSNEEILKFSKLFEDEITLDNLTYQQLSALCQLLEIPAVGTSYVLRFQLEMKLRQLEADDKIIQKEGLDTMAVWELQDACRMRGMRALGVSETRLKSQLEQWLDLHLNHKVPTSLLLLSRTLYLPENLSPEEQIKATISALPDATAEEVKVTISEVAGDRVDNKSKLEVIKQEEEIILKEKIEQEMKKKEEEKLKAAADIAAAGTEALKAELASIDSARVLTPAHSELIEPSAAETMTDKAVILDHAAAEKAEEIDSADLSKIEDILERVAEKRLEINTDVEDLRSLKEDVIEHKENLEDLKGVVATSGASVLKESSSSVRLRKKVDKLISQLEKDLPKHKDTVGQDIQVRDGRMPVATILPEPVEEKPKSITIVELLDAIKSTSDAKKFEKIAKVLDEDQDGVIDVNDALKVIELLGNESMKVKPEQLKEIMEILRKENAIEAEEKKEKKLQQAADAAASVGNMAAKKAASPVLEENKSNVNEKMKNP